MRAEVKRILNQAGINLSKRLDQHFLVDERILQREVEYANITKDDNVLEIGPGIGTLTRFLAKAAKKVVVIEKDRKFESFLFQIPNTEIIIADALKIDFPPCNKILGNLPYSISSDITFKILSAPIEIAVLCYQKEFAERMTAQPGTKDYSRLTVNCTLRADIELLETVSKTKYFPQPKVDSAIVRLTPKQITLPPKFDAIVRALFQHKNQKVRNALVKSAHEIGTKKDVEKFVEKLGAAAQKRVISLTPEEIAVIAEKW
ncbi:TPA: ribosomal RNA small subunit methyltransferase A [archaeon]|uniref:Probable ribosomal RNA small subunit methyltransferase A n=1 Tax=Candidatus Naiadarchaeum limnaeum TaxID=2756139 RepID=A0A832V5W4_9ARCH|nr:ribosomal RNA small subunit methyltransferase A [Candidatus Naiadarchaeales archaeon SRR2090153.bin1042]HIK00825.1 ribosomal RNA small subunit methyltransferase A [Candidatus Naiadarchaeum limnaeum]